MQALDTFTLHRFQRGVGRGGKHSALCQRFGAVRCISGRHFEPFHESGLRSVKNVHERHQQRLPAGVHPRYVSRRHELHAEDDPNLASARRCDGFGRKARGACFER